MTDATDIPPAPQARRRRRSSSLVAGAIKAAAAVGVSARIEIDSAGKIVIFTGSRVEASPENDLDRELEQWEARHGEG
jgi:hypothetical protein